MNNRKIQGIVYEFLQGEATFELVPCIFQVTIVATSPEPKRTISENEAQKMISLMTFILRLQNEMNTPEKINRETFKQDLDLIFSELESALSKAGYFLNDTESFELMKRIRKFAADYNALVEFINEKVKA